jgi:hypothetical protein
MKKESSSEMQGMFAIYTRKVVQNQFLRISQMQNIEDEQLSEITIEDLQ